MKMRLFLASLWIAIFVLVACGSKQTEESNPPQASQTPKEHIFSAQERALRKAQQLNTVVEQHATDMRERIEEETK